MQATKSSSVSAAALVRAAMLCLCVSFSSLALAQEQGSQEQPNGGMGGHMGHHQMPSVDQQLSHMTKALNLNDDQQAKVKTILENQRTQMEQLHNDTSTPQQDKFSKMREIHENSNTQIKALLNNDQQTKFDQMQQKQKERMKNRWGAGSSGNSSQQ
jgi:hypothetical protein